jgi:hypothetical protein
MNATTMHFAFLQSKSVNTSTPLGKRILAVAVRHHEEMVAELKAKKEAKEKQAQRLATSLDVI